jgi:hypothetical protein
VGFPEVACEGGNGLLVVVDDTLTMKLSFAISAAATMSRWRGLPSRMPVRA